MKLCISYCFEMESDTTQNHNWIKVVNNLGVAHYQSGTGEV